MCFICRPLPDIPRVPNLRLSGEAFANLLMVFEFLHNFGETLGFGKLLILISTSYSVNQIFIEYRYGMSLVELGFTRSKSIFCPFDHVELKIVRYILIIG
jgi:hypothetical protein